MSETGSNESGLMLLTVLMIQGGFGFFTKPEGSLVDDISLPPSDSSRD